MWNVQQVYKLPPCGIYNVPAMEAWLSDLAASGLYVRKAGGRLFTFAKGEASDTCYRLEPVTDDSSEPPCDMQDAYAQAGWEFAAVLQKSFFIWRSIRPGADELHSDPVIHSSAYERIFSRLRKNAVSTAVLALVLLSMFVCGMLLSPRPVTLFLANPSMPLLVIFNTISGIRAVQQFLCLYRLKRTLASGIPALHRKDYRKHLLLHRAAGFCTALLAFFLIAMPFCVFAKNWKQSVPDVTISMPYIPLDLIEQGQDFSWHKDSYIRSGVDAYNNAEFSWTLFVPAHYEIYQQGELRSVWQNNGITATEPSAHTEYFRLALPCLALPLYREQLRSYVRSTPDAAVTELSHPGFDSITTAKSEGFTQLFACRGRQVIHIQYWGLGSLEDYLDVLAAAFQQEDPRPA
ncbi:MAG: DUF2812 domain-containing protein [Eubacterium sp.]|nr:DUF2812 domain-containing protein [Eubacterium sp.]